jgi:dienelactone hydrolase
MSCCPSSALPYLAAQPANNGTKSTSGGVEFYEICAASKAAIILFPYVWGWDSGRTRALADAFAEQGYHTYVPKVLRPTRAAPTATGSRPPSTSPRKARSS